MQRVAFYLRLRPGTGPAYDDAHRQVWPEMLSLLKRAGVSEYSIFRRDELLFLYMHVEDFEDTWKAIEQDPANMRWQAAMAAYFQPVQDAGPDERFPMMHEVFFLA